MTSSRRHHREHLALAVQTHYPRLLLVICTKDAKRNRTEEKKKEEELDRKSTPKASLRAFRLVGSGSCILRTLGLQIENIDESLRRYRCLLENGALPNVRA